MPRCSTVMEASESSAGTALGLRATLKRLTPRPIFISRLQRAAGRRVLLTFDDGPDPEVTPRLLDRLEASRARAVLFVVGDRAQRHPEILREASRRGHVIGNHSHLHEDDYVSGGPRLTLRRYYRDCQRCQAVVAGCVGAPPRLFRPPGGHVSPTTLLVPRLLGMRAVGWSVEVGDWAFRTEEQAREGATRLLARVQPLDIVLLHDNNPLVLPLVDELLPALIARGFDLGASADFI